MSFSYDSTLAADTDKIRFNISDTIENEGRLPNGANFQDEELTAVISMEGSWQMAVASCFDRLAAAWATEDSSINTRNGSFSRNTSPQYFRDLATDWRDKYDVTVPTRAIYGIPITKTDGY